jgi:hypothetical protein
MVVGGGGEGEGEGGGGGAAAAAAVGLLSVKLLDRLFAPTFPSAIMQMLF